MRNGQIYSSIIKMDIVMASLGGMMHKHKTQYGGCVYTFSMPTRENTDVATYFELQQNPDASWQIVSVNVQDKARPYVTYFDYKDMDKAIEQSLEMIQQAFMRACDEDSYVYACRYTTLNYNFNKMRKLVTTYAQPIE